MADRRRSARTRRRLRLNVARRMAEDMKRRRLEESSQSDSSGAEGDASGGSSEEQVAYSFGSHGSDMEPGYSGHTGDVFRREEDSATTEESRRFHTQESSSSNVSLSSRTDDEFSSALTSSSEQDFVVADSAVPLSNPPLFDGACISSHDFELLFLSLAQRHNLTYASQNDILKLLRMMLPTPNRVPSSYRTIETQFVEYRKQTSSEHYCGSCFDLLVMDQPCPKERCKQAMQKYAVFVQLQLAMQLKERFEDPDFADLLKYRFKRQQSSDILGDVFDGAEYQKHSDFFVNEYNVSFTLNYDGAPVFKSSAMQIWPVQLHLNELPYCIRTSRQYLFLAGIWCSPKKPPTEVFMRPLIEELKVLATEGVKVPVKGEEVICKAKLLMTVADLPAKALLLNCNQYNGQYGCPTCKHKGERVRSGRGYARAYGHQETTLRSHEEHLQHAIEAEATKTVTFGVKGMSILHSLPDFDIVNNNPVDYMHCVLLGVVKKRLLPLWFDSVQHKNPWYIGTKYREVDARLATIKPPDSVTRVPRSIHTRSQWKATECKTFLLYYLPVLVGILPDMYVVHSLMLSKALRLLLGEKISVRDVDMAEQLLLLFIKLHQQYYGLQHCTINVHLLSHLPYYVKLFGPCWTHSAFPFEDLMGYLVHKSHATHDIANQIVTSFLLQWKLHVASRKSCLPVEFSAFLTSLRSSQTTRSSCITLTNNAVAIGKSEQQNLTEEEAAAVKKILYTNVDLEQCTVVVHQKVSVFNHLYFSKNTKRVKKKNSYSVIYKDVEAPTLRSYGHIEKFVSVSCPSSEANTFHAAVIRPLITTSGLPDIDCPSEVLPLLPILLEGYVTLCREESILVAIHLEDIIGKCFEVSTGNVCFLSPLVNEKEHDL